MAGLTRRRKAEKELFDTPVAKWLQDDKGWRYKLADGKFAKKTWVEDKGDWYYLNADGYMAHDEYVKSSNYDSDKKLYYVNSNGRWNDKTYRIMSDFKGRWLAQINAKWYATNTWIKIGKYRYYANSKGYFITNRKMKIGNVTYSFDGKGNAKVVK